MLGPAAALRQAEGLQPVAQERGALHADLPAVPLHLPLDWQDRRRQQPCRPALTSASSEAGVTVWKMYHSALFLHMSLMLHSDHLQLMFTISKLMLHGDHFPDNFVFSFFHS